MKHKLLTYATTILTIVALISSSSASLFWLYQPKVPKSLKT